MADKTTIHFELLPGERLLMEGTPAEAQKTSWMMGSAIGLTMTVMGIFFIPVSLWAVAQQYKWHRWWLTDRRIVVQTGIIGYQVRSIPLNRITDVSVTCSWWDQLFGLTHINVRDMTGEVGQQGVSTGVVLWGVPNAPVVRDAILRQVGEATTTPDDDDKLGRVVELLEVMAKQAA